MFREVFAGGLLALLAPAAWGAGGSGPAPEPATPEGSAGESREAASMALDEADGVVYDPDRTQAFVAAYTALMRVGDVEAARRAFSSALAAATAEENEGAYRQAEEFIRMGAAAAREDDSDSADRLAASGEMGLRTLVLTGLA